MSPVKKASSQYHHQYKKRTRSQNNIKTELITNGNGE